MESIHRCAMGSGAKRRWHRSSSNSGRRACGLVARLGCSLPGRQSADARKSIAQMGSA